MIELWKMTPYLSAVDSMTQPLNEIGKSLYTKGGSSGRRTSQLYRHYFMTYEFSFSSEVPTGYQYGMLYDLVIEQVKSEDVWWI